jgi:RimJ/RimL family protein N-acetyltransferase
MIAGRIVHLRAPERRDAATLHRWANDPDLWRNFGGWHFPYTEASTLAWIDARRDSNGTASTDQVLCIDVPGTGIVGTASLSRIDWKNRTAEFSIMIGDEAFRGKGYARDAIHAMMAFAFDELALERLDAHIVGSNLRSQRFFAKCGWTQEGVRKGWYYRDGRRHDQVLYGIQKDAWIALRGPHAAHAPAHRRPGVRPAHDAEHRLDAAPVVGLGPRRKEGQA